MLTSGGLRLMCFMFCFQEYGADGLRTLALAYRELSEDEWETWSESHRCADKATDCREDRLAAAYDKIEQDMMVETAVNIGYSCKMLTDEMTEVFIISGHTVQSVRQEL
ncbi:hypothetical protein GOODEAATRI_022325, partial [Goodea atripinnis]